MDEFTVGDTVQVVGPNMTGLVGTYVWKDEKRDTYLIRINNVTQLYFTAEELKKFRA